MTLIPAGAITITQGIDQDGDLLTRVGTPDDMPVVTALGLLRLSEDSLLHGPKEDE